MSHPTRRAFLTSVLGACALMAAPLRQANARRRRIKVRGPTRVEGGRAWRLSTANGPVYVWMPPGYQHRTAGMVVYVHGYGTDPDHTWKMHNVAEQFRKSRQNALFVVPGAPRSKHAPVLWPALGELRRTLRRAGLKLPNGPVVAIGHSGAYRTLAGWLDNARLTEVILLDAFYAKDAAFEAFIRTGPHAKRHKLVLVGQETAVRSEAFVRRLRGVRQRKIPSTYASFTRRQRRARLLYIKSQYEHMEMITNGKVLPLILRLTPLSRL